MLQNLSIQSFVIIENMQVSFFEGMSVLTGETGAGKSIIIDAIGQLCGQRGSGSFVRKGCKKAVIEGVFDLMPTPELLDVFSSIGIDFDEETIITKEIFANGKSSVRINYRNATNTALKMLAPHLIHIHSQFETQSLFSVKNHIHLLDRYIGSPVTEALDDYNTSYKAYMSVSKKIKQLEEEDFSDEQIEFYQSQYAELEDIEYTDEDVEDLEKEAQIMKDYEKLNMHLSQFDRYLTDSNQAFDLLESALKEAEIINDYEEFEHDYDDFYNEYYTLMDTHQRIMDRFHAFSFDEYRYNEIQSELYKIQRLKRKYGYTMEAIYNARDDLKEKIENALNRDYIIEELNNEKKKYHKESLKKAAILHSLRVKGAERFEKEIKKQMNDLYLPKAELKVRIDNTSLNNRGSDDITLMVAMNAGVNFTPLNESASGGEISRLMLAIKTITLKDEAVDCIIFDEVDTGVSGKVADAIGSKMEDLAKEKQIICITHLPQVAVHAKTHYAIMKESQDNETYTSIKELNDTDRVEEIAKMLSGDQITPEAINNAKRLLER